MIDLFFILLNFAIIVGLTLYAARRFFLPNLKNKVEQKKISKKIYMMNIGHCCSHNGRLMKAL